MGRTPTSPSDSPTKKRGKAADGSGITVAKATDLDVLLGRGKGAYLSKGNQRLLQIVSLYLPAYMAANKNKEKIQITNEIVIEVKQGGGRFLCEDTSGRLYEAPDQKARIKVAQAIRHKRRLFEDEGGDAAAAENKPHGNSSNVDDASRNNFDNNGNNNNNMMANNNNNMNMGGFPVMMDQFASSSRLVGSHDEMMTMHQTMMAGQPPPQGPSAAMFPSPPTHLLNANTAMASTKSKPPKKTKAPAANAKKPAGGRKASAATMEDDRAMLAGALLSLQAANATTFAEDGEEGENEEGEQPIKEGEEEQREQKQQSSPNETTGKEEEEDGKFPAKKREEGKGSNDDGTDEDGGPKISNFASL